MSLVGDLSPSRLSALGMPTPLPHAPVAPPPCGDSCRRRRPATCATAAAVCWGNGWPCLHTPSPRGVRRGRGTQPCTGSRRTTTRASSSAWLHDLSVLFSWAAADEASYEPGGEDRGRQAPEPQQQAPAVVLDGANLLWAYGHALARRFGCKVYPASAGLLVALNYEPWLAAGVRTTALLPSSYVRSDDLALVADGCGGGEARLVQRDKVYRSSADDQWVCRPLDRLVSGGQVTLVRRSKGYHGRADDDREILRSARLCNGYVCSNDQFREHFRLKGDEPNRPKGVGEAVLFRNKRRFMEWGRERRFGCTFAVAPGLDNALLVKMIRAQQMNDAAEAAAAAAQRAAERKRNPLSFELPQEDEPVVEAAVMSEEAIRNMLYTQPWRFKLPVYFEPHPGPAMLTAFGAFQRLQKERQAQALVR